MAISFKKPTWHNVVTPWTFDDVTETWTEQADITGQIYTPLRNSDDEDAGLLYFEYPKEDDVLRDRWDHNDTGNRDFILFSFPTGALRQVGYWVEDVLPRWFGFGNEHLIAVLVKMTPLEITQFTTGEGPTNVISPLSSLFANPGTPLADGIFPILVKGYFYQPSGLPLAGVPVTLVPSGSGIILTPQPVDVNGAGYAQWVVVSTTPGIENYSVTSGAVTVTSNDVDWQAPTPPPASDVDVTVTMANGSCGSCADLDGVHTMTYDGSLWFVSPPIAWACSGLGGGEVVFRLAFVGATAWLYCTAADYTADFATWSGDATGWDFVTPLPLALQPGASGLCTWPDPIMISG